QKELETKEAAYQKFLAETPPLWRGPDRSTAQQDRLFKIDARLTALRLRRTGVEAAITMLERAIRDGRNPAATIERLSTLQTAGAPGPVNPIAAPEPGGVEPGGKVSLEEQLGALQLQKTKLLALRGPN